MISQLGDTFSGLVLIFAYEHSNIAYTILWTSMVFPISFVFLEFDSFKSFTNQDLRTQNYIYKAILVNYVQIAV